MKIQEKIKQVSNQNLKDRDLVVSEILDLIEYDSLSKDVVVNVLIDLTSILTKENDPDVIESIFNLFSTIFTKQEQYTKLILPVCIEQLPKLDPGSLAHALVMISESNLQNRNQIIQEYLESENLTIKKLAQELTAAEA
jgi:hypothetical protein